MKILTSFCDGVDKLRSILPEDEIKCIEEADMDFVRSAEVLAVYHWKDVETLIKEMRNLRYVQALTAGTDHINLSAISEDVELRSNAGVNARAVAEHALALILSAIKRIPYRDREMRKGNFPQMLGSQILSGKRALIVGFGHIGRAIAEMLACLGVSVSAVNRSGKYDGDIRVERVAAVEELDEMLRDADIVVIALPLTPETKALIDRKRLGLMKKDAILVNVSRGKIIAERDLYEHLKENPEFIAAIDVWWEYGKEFRQNYPFEGLENIILSPHCSAVYPGWFEDMVVEAGRKIREWESRSS